MTCDIKFYNIENARWEYFYRSFKKKKREYKNTFILIE